MNLNAWLAPAPLSRIKSRLLSIPTALFLSWIFLLLWGERRIFNQSVTQCRWDKWEIWVRERTQTVESGKPMLIV